jgi:ABC-type antimicrobial peptide transport system permease subunit
VAVVNEAFARKFDMGSEVVGKFMSRDGSDSLTIQIVGLVKDAKYSEVKDDVPPLFFIPNAQVGNISALSFYVRTSLPPETILRDVQRVVATLDPALPVSELKTMPQQIRENVFLDRMISTLSAAFAVLATLLAAVGLYGVLAYTVAQRTREIGVRMALGADGRRVRAMVLWQVGRMLLVGGIVGIAGALALGRAAGSLLFGLQGYDPLVVVLATLTLAAVALGAGFLPAARAARVEPMRALRYE